MCMQTHTHTNISTTHISLPYCHATQYLNASRKTSLYCLLGFFSSKSYLINNSKTPTCLPLLFGKVSSVSLYIETRTKEHCESSKWCTELLDTFNTKINQPRRLYWFHWLLSALWVPQEDEASSLTLRKPKTSTYGTNWGPKTSIYGTH